MKKREKVIKRKKKKKLQKAKQNKKEYEKASHFQASFQAYKQTHYLSSFHFFPDLTPDFEYIYLLISTMGGFIPPIF